LKAPHYQRVSQTPRKQFFFEKKNQKTFTCFEYVPVESAALSERTKVFCFFFSKKKYFLCFAGVSVSTRIGIAGLRLRQQSFLSDPRDRHV